MIFAIIVGMILAVVRHDPRILSQTAEAENTESEGHSAATAADQETDPTHSEQTERSTSQTTSTRKVHSIANEFSEKDQIVLLSIDLEHGGPTAEILQLSVVTFKPSGEPLGEFNKYIKPPSGAVISSNVRKGLK
jgi:hypothetical protein